MNAEKLQTWLKKYWPWLAAGAGLLVILYLVRRNQAAQAGSFYGSYPQAGGGLSQQAIAANTQLETTRLTTQEKLAEAQLAQQTAQIKAQLDAQTQQLHDQALTQQTASQQKAYLEAVQAQTNASNTKSLYSLIGTALPQLIGLFKPSPASASLDFTSPTAMAQWQATGSALTGFGPFPGINPGAGPSSGLPLPMVDPNYTQASTIILPTPTFDMQGPPLESFTGLGGVAAMPAWGSLGGFGSFGGWGFG